MIDTIHDKLKRQVAGWGRWFGFESLNREQTADFLSDYLIATHPGSQVVLPAVDNLDDRTRPLFTETVATTEPGHVWRYQFGHQPATLLRSGALAIDGKVMCTDWLGNRRLLGDMINRRERTTQEVDTLIAPWSHYVDGIRFGGYYDYVVLIAAKLCRIKAALPEAVFRQAAVAYPLFGTPYERELLVLIGVDESRVFDSRLTNVRFKTCVLGNSGHWFYPNMADILALKQQVEARLPAALGQPYSERVYISRSSRRRILNETDLRAVLKKYDIDYIEDTPRSIAEQVAIYRNASFIIGPHGASFTNILWCRPGTHLVELFAPSYMPEFFLFLANQLGLRYSAYFYGPEPEKRFSGLEEDIVVSIPELDRSLHKLFGQKATA